MSERIEEQERARMEAAREAKKAADKAQLGKEGDFRKLVHTMMQKQTAGGQQQTQQQNQRNSANSRLRAREGIVGRDLAKKLLTEGEARQTLGRKARAGEQGEQETRRQSQKVAAAPIKRSRDDEGGKGQNPGRQPQRRSTAEADDKKGRSGARTVDQLLAAHAGIQTPNAILGVQASESKAAGATGGPSLQKMLDEMVAAVRQGHDVKGLEFLDIDLKQGTLAGARLSLHQTAGGVDIQFFSDDKEISQLLSSGASAKQLSQMLGQHNIRLGSLEVNRRRVLG